jgi:hypothetical protein
MALTTLPTAALANDAVDNTKLDLADNYAFSGTVSGISGTASAWVNFDGTGTPTIRADLNVSSITDNGAGQYTVNFTTSMPDTNYAAVSGGGGSGRNNTLTDVAFPNNLRTVGSIGVDTQYAHTTPFDPPFVCVAIFR